MKHTHMAVGLIPDDLANLGVVLQWTPGESPFTLALFDGAGVPVPGQSYDCDLGEVFDFNPPILKLDMSVYHGLMHKQPLAARLTQSLAGFGYFQWFSPADMSRSNREKYEAVAK